MMKNRGTAEERENLGKWGDKGRSDREDNERDGASGQERQTARGIEG